MLIELVNKFLMILFFVTTLNALRHAYYFVQSWVTTVEGEPAKYRLSNKSLITLGVSIAYLLTTIFTGIKL